MSITLVNRISGAAIAGRFARRQAKRKRPEHTQEICGPTSNFRKTRLTRRISSASPSYWWDHPLRSSEARTRVLNTPASQRAFLLCVGQRVYWLHINRLTYSLNQLIKQFMNSRLANIFWGLGVKGAERPRKYFWSLAVARQAHAVEKQNPVWHHETSRGFSRVYIAIPPLL